MGSGVVGEAGEVGDSVGDAVGDTVGDSVAEVASEVGSDCPARSAADPQAASTPTSAPTTRSSGPVRTLEVFTRFPVRQIFSMFAAAVYDPSAVSGRVTNRCRTGVRTGWPPRAGSRRALARAHSPTGPERRQQTLGRPGKWREHGRRRADDGADPESEPEQPATEASASTVRQAHARNDITRPWYERSHGIVGGLLLAWLHHASREPPPSLPHRGPRLAGSLVAVFVMTGTRSTAPLDHRVHEADEEH